MALRRPPRRPELARPPAPQRGLRAADAVHRGQYLSRLHLHPALLPRLHAARRRTARRAAKHFDRRRQAIGAAVFLDGLDGRIARMTNTTSDFGREMDSLADVISFGIAPAVLAFAWGVQFVDPVDRPEASRPDLQRAATSSPSSSCSAAPAAWRASTSRRIPIPKNPGRPDRKYFVGLPIPAAAAMVAAVVYAACDSRAARLVAALRRLACAAAAARLPDGQHLALLQFQGHQPEQGLLAPHHDFGGRVHLRHGNYAQTAACWAWPPPMSASGILIRIGGILRRRFKRPPPPPAPEPSLG